MVFTDQNDSYELYVLCLYYRDLQMCMYFLIQQINIATKKQIEQWHIKKIIEIQITCQIEIYL